MGVLVTLIRESNPVRRDVERSTLEVLEHGREIRCVDSDHAFVHIDGNHLKVIVDPELDHPQNS